MNKTMTNNIHENISRLELSVYYYMIIIMLIQALCVYIVSVCAWIPRWCDGADNKTKFEIIYKIEEEG